MALEEILDKINKDTEKEEESIAAQYLEESNQVLEEAKKKADEILEDQQRKANEEAEILKRQRVSAATLDGRYELEGAKEHIENEYIEALKSKIHELEGTEEYYSFLQKKMEDAWRKLGPGSLAYMSAKDAHNMKERGFALTIISKEIDPLGGAIVTSADGKMIIDLTFSEILRSKDDKIRKIVRDSIR